DAHPRRGDQIEDPSDRSIGARRSGRRPRHRAHRAAAAGRNGARGQISRRVPTRDARSRHAAPRGIPAAINGPRVDRTHGGSSLPSGPQGDPRPARHRRGRQRTFARRGPPRRSGRAGVCAGGRGSSWGDAARGGCRRVGRRPAVGGGHHPASHPRGRSPAAGLAGRGGPGPTRGSARRPAPGRGGDRARRHPPVAGAVSKSAATGPLADLTILALSAIVSGGTATSMLADLGAEVIKIEHPKGGDPLRSWGPFISGQSIWWKIVSRNKKSITLNLSEARGQQILTDLVGRADVLVENFRPGTLERWGLAPEGLLGRNPRLVVLRISGFGQTGPYRHRPGFGTVAEAMSGLVAITGFPDSPPLVPAIPLADEVPGLTGALAVMTALHHRAASGRGQGIGVSLYEPLFRLLVPYVTQYTARGVLAQRAGNEFPDAAPRNLYRAAGGAWIAVSATSQRVFERLAAAIGRPDLPADPRFSDNAARVEHRRELDAIIGEWMAGRS